MLRIGALVSGGGTNLQTILDHIEQGVLQAEVAAVVSDNPDAYALERAKKNHIESAVIQKRAYNLKGAYEEKLVRFFEERNIQLVVTAGFITILGSNFIKVYKDRIINIHPSLIPAFCGKGYYGIKVHQAALEKGVKITGATVHFVDEGADTGPIILQKAVSVLAGDTPEILQKRVMVQAEQVILPEAIRLFIAERLIIENGIVKIKDERI